MIIFGYSKFHKGFCGKEIQPCESQKKLSFASFSIENQLISFTVKFRQFSRVIHTACMRQKTFLAFVNSKKQTGKIKTYVERSSENLFPTKYQEYVAQEVEEKRMNNERYWMTHLNNCRRYM